MEVNSNPPFVPVRVDGADEGIVVFLSHMHREGKRNFRCLNCGKIIFQYNSKVQAIVDGADAPFQSAPVDIQCHRCKILYRVL
jgi:phage FluMu protein Com